MKPKNSQVILNPAKQLKPKIGENSSFATVEIEKVNHYTDFDKKMNTSCKCTC